MIGTDRGILDQAYGVMKNVESSFVKLIAEYR